MNENLNLVEILKDCPKGTKLYSPVSGEAKFVKIEIMNGQYPIQVEIEERFFFFTSQGKLYNISQGECLLFPSKDQRDWSKFNPPCEFKDGDILSYQNKNLENRTIYIYRYRERVNTSYYVALSGDTNSTFRINNKGEGALNGYDKTVCFATEEEKQKLFQAIKDNGYKWNAETKTLEKLVKPRFEVGDWIITPKNKVLQITSIEGTSYRFNNESYYWEICYCDEQCRFWTIQDAKDGDVLTTSSGAFIYNGNNGGGSCPGCYCGINTLGRFKTGSETHWTGKAVFPATKEQRNDLMKAMNDAGYEWDAEKKELKKLVEPKFNPKTLQPFDKVLGRNKKSEKWKYQFFSNIRKNSNYPYVCISYYFKYCIPYNDDTKHLVGTTEEAPEYYRYWED